MGKTYTKAPADIEAMANEILCQFDTHKPLLDARVKIDYILAFSARDEKTGEKKSDAIRSRGCRALGQARILSLKQRAAGRGDAEVLLDGDWWNEESNEPEQRALLDHELHHIALKLNASMVPIRDDLNRPRLFLRPHDFEFGWFAIIAQRHGMASGECQSAKVIMDKAGQWLWPDLVNQSPRQ